MAILLIRHGETPGNRDRIIQLPDTPLSDHGIAQAGRLAGRLATTPIQEIWSSHLRRAEMTAEAIAGTTGAPIHVDPQLEERSLGGLRGTRYADLDFNPWDDDYVPPEGESWSVFHARVDRAWDAIARHWFTHYSGDSAAGHLAVVSHGLFLGSLIERCLTGVDPAELSAQRDPAAPLRLGNTALTVVEPEGPDVHAAEYPVTRLGCVAHLDGETADDRDAVAGI